jgi:spermidine synthase
MVHPRLEAVADAFFGSVSGVSKQSGHVFAGSLLIVLLSGAAALSHQLVWTRRLIDLLGASHASAARVFGCFFLGLAIGAALAAWWLPRVRRPWRWVAGAELGVAILSVPALTLPYWTGWLWPAVGIDALAGWPGGMIKAAVSAIVVIPPAMAMGTTLPWLGAALLHGRRTLGREGIWLYAVNTAGGVVGLALTVLVALQALGAAGSMIAAAMLNLLAAALCLAFDRASTTSRPVEPADADAHAAAVDRAVLHRALFMAFFSGMGILAFEVAALQVLMLVAPLSFYAPAAILIVAILMLAVGAAVTPMLTAWLGRARTLLPWAAGVTGVALILTPGLFFLVVEQSGGLPPAPDFAQWLRALLLLAVMVLGPALLLAGLIFPLTCSMLSRDGGDASGRRWGWLLAVNGLGGLIGAELTYRLLLPQLGPHAAIGVLGVGYLLIGGGLAWWQRRYVPSIALLGGTAAAAVAVVVWVGAMPTINPHLDFNVLEHRTGREGSVAVIEKDGFGRAILLSNQYMLGGTAARWDQERQALLPLVLHPHPTQVGFIGVATGISPGAALMVPGVERITMIELSPIVADFARQHFAAFNHGVVGHKRVRLVVDDGRTAIAAMPDAFDVLVGDLFLPWGPGEARLYSHEHFEAAKESLKPGGVFCQWLAMYQLTPEHFQIIADTFAAVFDEVHLFQVGFNTHRPAIALVGVRDGQLDWNVIQRRTTTLADHDLQDPLMSHPAGPGLLYLGQYMPGAEPLNTLNNMRVELLAGRERVTGNPGTKYFFGARWVEFVRGRAAEISHTHPFHDSARTGALLTLWEQREQLRSESRLALRAELRRMIRRLDVFPVNRPAIDLWPGDTSWDSH